VVEVVKAPVDPVGGTVIVLCKVVVEVEVGGTVIVSWIVLVEVDEIDEPMEIPIEEPDGGPAAGGRPWAAINPAKERYTSRINIMYVK